MWTICSKFIRGISFLLQEIMIWIVGRPNSLKGKYLIACCAFRIASGVLSLSRPKLRSTFCCHQFFLLSPIFFFYRVRANHMTLKRTNKMKFFLSVTFFFFMGNFKCKNFQYKMWIWHMKRRGNEQTATTTCESWLCYPWHTLAPPPLSHFHPSLLPKSMAAYRHRPF